MSSFILHIPYFVQEKGDVICCLNCRKYVCKTQWEKNVENYTEVNLEKKHTRYLKD